MILVTAYFIDVRPEGQQEPLNQCGFLRPIEGLLTLKKVVTPHLMSTNRNGRRNLFQIIAFSISDRSMCETSLASVTFTAIHLFISQDCRRNFQKSHDL